MSFALDISRFADKAKNNGDEVVRQTLFLAAQSVVLRSPVGDPELWAENAQASYGRRFHNVFAAKPLKHATLKKTYPLRHEIAAANRKARAAAGKPGKRDGAAAGKYIGGRFRANWQFGIGSVNTTTTEQTDKSGAATLGRLKAAISAVSAGPVFWISNSLPYAERLENGWSKQAPRGIVKLTLVELPRQVSAFAASLK